MFSVRSFLWKCYNYTTIREAKKLHKQNTNFTKLSTNYLRKLLLHAKDQVPYYKKILKELDIQNFQIKDLMHIPTLTKDDIREHFSELCSIDIAERDAWKNFSGGSTGEPVPFMQDRKYQKWVNISLYYYYEYMLGIDWAASKKVMVWGSEKDIFNKTQGIGNRIKNRILQTKFINAFTPFTDEKIKQYLSMINKFKPDIIKGYTSSLVDLAEYAKYHSIVMHTPQIVMTAAEPLDEYKRKVLTEVFGTKVLNFYGSRETSSIAAEVVPGEFLVLLFNNIVEVENDEILITNLHNYSMPLIRFKIGDLCTGVSYNENIHHLPIMETISGRYFDIFQKKNGERYHSQYIVRLFFHKLWIEKFQIIQVALDEIVLRIKQRIGSEKNQNDITYITQEIKKMMGEDSIVTREYVEEIPKSASGKYLYTINNLLNTHGRGVGEHSSMENS